MPDAEQNRSESQNESPTNQGGRPPKPQSERRTHSHGLYLSESEKQKIKSRADAANLSMNEYLRRKALGTPIEPKVRRAKRHDLTWIALDIETIAEKAEEAALSAEIEEKLKETLEKIEQLIEEIGPAEEE